jgi:NAD(P)-dependent dehydrogenase (short-subunit alcohol dehydrogenase family)
LRAAFPQIVLLYGMNAQTIFFTGATSGFGKVAAMKLANDGAFIVATTRSKEAGAQLLLDFKKHFPEAKGHIELIDCDLTSFESVVSACLRFEQQYGRLDVLINNAGLWNYDWKQTQNGIEETLQVNLLAPILITRMLLPLLLKTPNARTINTASGLYSGTINFEDIENRLDFSGFKAYRQSKLGVILWSRLLAGELKPEQVGVYIHHPGLVDTKLSKNAGSFSKWFFATFGRTVEKGAETLIFLVEAPGDKLVSGGFYKDLKVMKTGGKSNDVSLAERLLSVCREYIVDYLPVNPK